MIAADADGIALPRRQLDVWAHRRGRQSLSAAPTCASSFNRARIHDGATALARARLRLPLDESLAEEGSFVRPIPARSVLYGINEEGRVALAEVLYADGELSVTNTSILTPLIQQILLDPSTGFDRYEVLPSSGTTSLDILPIRLSSDGTTDLPRFTLTVVGGTSS